MFYKKIKEEAATDQSGAMDARDHFKNGASPKSQMSRENFLRKMNINTTLFIFAIIVTFSGCAIIKAYNAEKKDKIEGTAKLDDFESRMKDLGFTKKIVVYDFLSNSSKETVERYCCLHWWMVGIWLNYQKQLVALRLDRDNWKEIVIPFDKLQKVELVEDGSVVTSGRGQIGYFGGIKSTSTSKEYSKGLDVRIVAGDISSGTNAYLLKIYDPKYGQNVDKSHPDYKSILECAKSIADEIDNIVRNAGK